MRGVIKQWRHRSVSGQVKKPRFFRRSQRSRGESVSGLREGSLLKRERLHQTEREEYTRWRKFERWSGVKNGASQNWRQGRRT